MTHDITERANALATAVTLMLQFKPHVPTVDETMDIIKMLNSDIKYSGNLTNIAESVIAQIEYIKFRNDKNDNQMRHLKGY